MWCPLGDFLPVKNFNEEIKKHFDDWYPQEGCGVLAAKKGKPFWVPMTNVATEKGFFAFNPEEWDNLVKRYDIVAVIHDHINSSNEPSVTDLSYCNFLNIPFWIYSYPDMEVNKIDPVSIIPRLYCREYKFGERDCFEFARDFYRLKGLNIPGRSVSWINNWWEYDKDYFTKETIEDWGFREVQNLQAEDLLIFDTASRGFGDHCGIYIGEGIIGHHYTGRLSCREHFEPFWKSMLYKVYRYES